MLFVWRGKTRRITEVMRKGDALYLKSERALHRIMPYTDTCIRLSYTYEETFSDAEKPGVIAKPAVEWNYYENEEEIVLYTAGMQVRVNRESACYAYYSGDGKLLLREAESESRELEQFTKTILSNEVQEVEKIKTADGEKSVVKEAKLRENGSAYHTKLRLVFEDDEALYGLGQHEEGYGNLRGKTVYGHQANRKIALPMLVSTKGYGILTDTYSPYIFNDTGMETYIYTEADPEMDFYFMTADTMEGVIREYRHLTGKAALLPKWAFGYLQSKERFETQEEIERVAKWYRENNIGIDGIILDWFSWEDGKWGQKSFDKSRFPNPTEMVKKLHEQDYHFMISIWPSMDESCENYKEHSERGYILPGTNIYDAFRKEARELYWKHAKEGLFDHGIDAWWCDNCEPFTPEWNSLRRPEPAAAYSEYQKESAQRFDATLTNAYGLVHAGGIWEGQKADCPDKRVTILTRSGYTGAQRYGTILWSGDIAASWDTFRRQIASGLGFCASGHPYWTVDIGAFFVKRGEIWYWKGDYDNTTEDLGYRELFVRWHQWGSFLPVFRGHGTDCNREFWNFGKEGEAFYDALVSANQLRYELMPYIYSLVGRVWLKDMSMMRFLAFDYPEDKVACNIASQYMFGDSIMVCPVTRAMYYEADSREIEQVDTTVQVYLPKGKWYDYYTEECFEGGEYITVDAPLNKIPLFVKAGAIIPKTEFAPSTKALSDKLEICVYKGADGEFLYYNDEGDGYAYEDGAYEVCTLKYEEERGLLLPCELTERSSVTIRYIG